MQFHLDAKQCHFFVRGSVIIIVLLIPENTGSSQEMQLEP
jgi:hypothetical protein